MSVLTPPVSERDHAAGPPEARVTLVEYADFECPTCGEAFDTIRQVRRAFGPNLRFVFRHFPLRVSHPHALPAARAAETAAEQGKFWEMHDRLFRRQSKLTEPDLFAHADRLGLDLERFRRDMASPAIEARVLEQLASGVQSGVQGTPTFFIEGERYTGRLDGRSLMDALARAALAAAR